MLKDRGKKHEGLDPWFVTPREFPVMMEPLQSNRTGLPRRRLVVRFFKPLVQTERQQTQMRISDRHPVHKPAEAPNPWLVLTVAASFFGVAAATTDWETAFTVFWMVMSLFPSRRVT